MFIRNLWGNTNYCILDKHLVVGRRLCFWVFARLVCTSSSSVLPVVFGQKRPSAASWCAGVTVESKVVLFWLILLWFLSLVTPCFLGHDGGGRGVCAQLHTCHQFKGLSILCFAVVHLISLVISSVSCIFLFFLVHCNLISRNTGYKWVFIVPECITKLPPVFMNVHLCISNIYISHIFTNLIL